MYEVTICCFSMQICCRCRFRKQAILMERNHFPLGSTWPPHTLFCNLNSTQTLLSHLYSVFITFHLKSPRNKGTFYFEINSLEKRIFFPSSSCWTTKIKSLSLLNFKQLLVRCRHQVNVHSYYSGLCTIVVLIQYTTICVFDWEMGNKLKSGIV